MGRLKIYKSISMINKVNTDKIMFIYLKVHYTMAIGEPSGIQTRGKPQKRIHKKNLTVHSAVQ